MRDDLFRHLINVSGAGALAVGQTYTGTKHDDAQAGTADDDTFNYGQGGHDALSGGEGNDTFNFSAKLDAGDTIDGGAGDDTIVIKGDYDTVGLGFGATLLTGVEKLRLLQSPGYSLSFHDNNIAAGAQFEINAHALKATSNLIINGTAETDGAFIIDGGACDGFYRLGSGNDVVYGGKGDETIDPGFGKDSIVDGGGNDTVTFQPGAFDTEDYVNGVTTVADILEGDLSMAMSTQTIAYVDNFLLIAAAGFNPTAAFTMADGNVGKNRTLNVTVQENDLSTLSLTLDGSAESDGKFNVIAGKGDDVISGGAKDDTISTGAGSDRAYGGGGDDTFYGGSDFTLGEVSDGGDEFDTLHLSGPYNLALFSGMISSVEKIQFDTNADVTLNVIVGANLNVTNLIVDASVLGSAHALNFAANQGANAFSVIGGAGNDVITTGDYADTLTGGNGADQLYAYDGDDVIYGGAGNDMIAGLGGQDTITTGTGADGIIYGAVDQSTGKDYDEVIAFDAAADIFLTASPDGTTGVDAKIVGGTLSRATMNADLIDAVDAAHMHAKHAVLFAPDAGGLAGTLFLIVDCNGVAGYQANKDMVVLLTGAQHLNQLDADNFQVS